MCHLKVTNSVTTSSPLKVLGCVVEVLQVLTVNYQVRYNNVNVDGFILTHDRESLHPHYRQ